MLHVVKNNYCLKAVVVLARYFLRGHDIVADFYIWNDTNYKKTL
jgi:hypothetical protein